MISNYLPQILQSIVTVSAVITLSLNIQKRNTEKHASDLKAVETSCKTEIKNLKEDFHNKAKDLEKKVDFNEGRHREEIQNVDKKVKEQDEFIKKSIIGKLGSLEAEVKAGNNILRIIQEHYIKKGAGTDK